MLRIIASLVFLATVLVACSDNDGGPEQLPTPSPVPDSFDPNLLNAIILQEDDVDVPLVTRNFGEDSSRPVYTVSFGESAFSVQATIARIPDPIERDQEVFDMRQVFNGVVGGERTVALEGVDQAFAYISTAFNAPRETILVGADGFVFYIDIFSNSQAMSARVHTAGNLEELATKMLERIDQATSDPPSISPIDGAPTLQPSAPDQAGQESDEPVN